MLAVVTNGKTLILRHFLFGMFRVSLRFSSERLFVRPSDPALWDGVLLYGNSLTIPLVRNKPASRSVFFGPLLSLSLMSSFRPELNPAVQRALSEVYAELEPQWAECLPRGAPVRQLLESLGAALLERAADVALSQRVIGSRVEEVRRVLQHSVRDLKSQMDSERARLAQPAQSLPVFPLRPTVKQDQSSE